MYKTFRYEQFEMKEDDGKPSYNVIARIDTFAFWGPFYLDWSRR